MGIPMRLAEFEYRNRQVIRDAAGLAPSDLEEWNRARDWLASRVLGSEPELSQRKAPRARLVLPAHVAGLGPTMTENVGFRGLLVRTMKQHRLKSGDEVSVRVTLLGRSIYALAEVAWVDRMRIGLRITSIHPSDERALEATVCEQLTDHWGEA
jgi:hypothetical protein